MEAVNQSPGELPGDTTKLKNLSSLVSDISENMCNSDLKSSVVSQVDDDMRGPSSQSDGVSSMEDESSGSDSDSPNFPWNTTERKGSKRKITSPSKKSSSKKKKSGFRQRTMRVSAVEPGFRLKNLGPLKIFSCFKSVVGVVLNIDYLRDGSLLVTAADDNSYHKLQKLSVVGGHAVKVSHPVQSPPGISGVITDIPLDTAEGDIVDALSGDKVVSAQRISKRIRGQDTPTLSVRLIFSVDQLPDKVRLGYSQYTVKPYIAPVKQCYHCRRFGHYAAECRSAQRCARCGDNHSSIDCPTTKDNFKCPNCKGNHSAAYGGCQVFKEAKEVNVVAATKRISFPAARKIVTENKSYASVVDGSSVSNTPPISTQPHVPSSTPIAATRPTHPPRPSIPPPPRPTTPPSRTTPKGIPTVDAETQTDSNYDLPPPVTLNKLMEFFGACLVLLQPDIKDQLEPYMANLFGIPGYKTGSTNASIASVELNKDIAPVIDMTAEESTSEVNINTPTDTSTLTGVSDPGNYMPPPSCPPAENTTRGTRDHSYSRSRSRSPRISTEAEQPPKHIKGKPKRQTSRKHKQT